MNFNEFWIRVFGDSADKVEYDRIKEWKEQGEMNAKALRDMAAINSHAGELKNYKQYDTELALSKVLGDLGMEEVPQKKTRRLSVVWIAVGFFLLSSALIYGIYESGLFKKDVLQAVADAELSTFKKADGSTFIVDEKAKLVAHSEHEFELKGTAFFDIEKQNKTLKIQTKQGLIHVLGTSFDVLSDDHCTEVYMYEGTVEIVRGKEKIRLSAGEYGKLCAKEKIYKDKRSSAYFSHWRKELLTYDNVPLTNVLMDINRLFNKDVTIDPAYDKIGISATFGQSSFEKIMDELEIITGKELN